LSDGRKKEMYQYIRFFMEPFNC